MLEYPLMHIPLKPYIELYKTLIELGGNKDVRHGKNGYTALMFAAYDGRADIVKQLLSLKVDYQTRDNNGLNLKDHLKSPLMLMSETDKAVIQELLGIDPEKIK